MTLFAIGEISVFSWSLSPTPSNLWIAAATFFLLTKIVAKKPVKN
jgi:hypothetical protein